MEVANQQYAEASIKTGNNLRQIAYSPKVRELSHLSLPEVDNLIDVVAKVAPAGNVPGLILNGLARLSGRRPPADVVKRDVNLLFKGVEKALDKAVFGAFFAGPAAILWGYQNLLKLSGKDAESAFPEGTWQFYVDYAMREDTARHANETHGFDTLLNQHNIQLSLIDRTTAWAMATIHALHQYHEWLANEWRERTYTYLLQTLTSEQEDAARYVHLYQKWLPKIPYQRGSDAQPSQTYAEYRRRTFDNFLAEQMKHLKPNVRREWVKRIQIANSDLLAYQKQMSILVNLAPDAYGETRQSFSIERAHVGVIYQDRYYLIPACIPGTNQANEVTAVREQIATFMSQPVAKSSIKLRQLAQVKRTALADIHSSFNEALKSGLADLQTAPILINTTQRPFHLPLAEIRQAERGIGSHPLTIFDTGQSFVFDQSHIFFDGAWSSVLSEILTNEALSWAFYLNSLPTAQPANYVVKPISLPFETADIRLIEQSPKVTTEVSVETKLAKLPPILRLRKQIKQRNDLLLLTVNDVLILYRAIHHATYQLPPNLVAELEKLGQERRWETAVKEVLAALKNSPAVSPAIVIPVDATRRIPRERLYPLILEVPLGELDLLQLHSQTLEALTAYEKGGSDRGEAFTQFNQLQHRYLAALVGFSEVMYTAKQTALLGDSAAVRTVKLLGNIPTPLQRVLDQIPNRFNVLNDLIKGREVFSNVGTVARTSSLSRFITAKDDNENKELAWSVLTDASGRIVISLRDFRPYGAKLANAGHKSLATSLAQHYVDSYAHGLNNYIRDLQRIVGQSRETILFKA